MWFFSKRKKQEERTLALLEALFVEFEKQTTRYDAVHQALLDISKDKEIEVLVKYLEFYKALVVANLNPNDAVKLTHLTLAITPQDLIVKYKAYIDVDGVLDLADLLALKSKLLAKKA